MGKVFALVDCNNFFASCEKIFNPRLCGKPIIVLSNNDGCVIARSNESKALGIKMGEPYFKVKQICEQQNIAVFSSNFQFYGDISQRVMSVLSNFTPNIQIYSIDEAFLDLTGLEQNIDSYQEEIVRIVYKWTGVPVSIGIAPTKTLAKIANYYAKKNNGTYNLIDEKVREEALRKLDIENVWGIGRKWATKFRTLGIGNAWDLARADAKFIRKNFSVIGEKIVYELNGISCFEMETIQDKKSITSSRSFCMPISDLENLEEAVSDYTSRAAVKLREQNSFASAVYVYLKLHRNDCGVNSPYSAVSSVLDVPTNNSAKLITAAKKALSQIYQKKIRYTKAGIILLDLVDRNIIQENLLHSTFNKREEVLFNMMDGINKKLGSNSVSLAAAGTKKPWQMKRDFCSNRYTTSWKELPLVS